MGKFLDIIRAHRQERPASESLSPSRVPDIGNARKTVGETYRLRDEWAKACLSLAESLDWEPVEFKPGHTAGASGAHGWRLFCTRANLTTLRDQTYPALLERRNMDRPPEAIL